MDIHYVPNVLLHIFSHCVVAQTHKCDIFEAYLYVFILGGGVPNIDYPNKNKSPPAAGE